jgi:hypothetical protein
MDQSRGRITAILFVDKNENAIELGSDRWLQRERSSAGATTWPSHWAALEGSGSASFPLTLSGKRFAFTKFVPAARYFRLRKN